jgi:MoaA/NifB/PqqE/SkfB family radical SAM enzyme
LSTACTSSCQPDHGPSWPERFDPARHGVHDPLRLEQEIDRSARGGPSLILWDLVGSCNLRCPSCPQGNMPATKNPKGLIEDGLFDRILDKLSVEFPKWQLHYYNWTEPLIHPSIVRYCRAAAERGFHLHLSSNLNHLKDAEGLMASGMKTFRISLSGFTQAVYGQTHRNGDIEQVKRNMTRLSEAKRATGGRTRIHVYFHKYRHNVHELSMMEAFARDLGFDFQHDWAYLMPVEKLFEHVEGGLPEADRLLADERMVPPLAEALRYFEPHRAHGCELIDQLTLDHQGNVALCCAVYDAKANFIGKYLEMGWAELQRAKYGHSICAKCMHYGAHVYYPHLGNPEWKAAIDEMAHRCLERPPAASAVRSSIRLPILHAPLAASA